MSRPDPQRVPARWSFTSQRISTLHGSSQRNVHVMCTRAGSGRYRLRRGSTSSPSLRIARRTDMAPTPSSRGDRLGRSVGVGSGEPFPVAELVWHRFGAPYSRSDAGKLEIVADRRCIATKLAGNVGEASTLIDVLPLEPFTVDEFRMQGRDARFGSHDPLAAHRSPYRLRRTAVFVGDREDGAASFDVGAEPVDIERDALPHRRSIVGPPDGWRRFDRAGIGRLTGRLESS